MSCVLAIDQGTTGSTCLVIDRNGQVLARTYREITQHFPAPGRVEHDAHEILDKSVEAAREAISIAIRQGGQAPVAIGITNQRETIVLWERATGRAVHRALVWQDKRTAERCEQLASQANMIAEHSGLVTDPYFSASKLEWLLSRDSNAERARRGELLAGTIDSWLIWNLSGGAAHVTDHSNASRTMLYDIDSRTWSPELCELFGVPGNILPRVVNSSGVAAESTESMLGMRIPIAGIAGDQQAALFGHGGWEAGDAKNTYGTGAFLLLNAGDQRPARGGGLLTTIACDSTGAPVYALEASIFIAGAAVQWLRDGLEIISESAETEAMAASLKSNDGVYFVPALVGLGAPDWEPQARGTIVGLTRGTTRAHLARAALEAMAYATRDVLGLMRERSAAAFDLLRVDGGASANSWLMQFQADVLGVPVERPAMLDSTALGAAGLAGLAPEVALWPDAESFRASSPLTRFEPGVEGTLAADTAYEGWRRAVRATLGWARDYVRP